MADRARVVIIGGGAVGASCLYHLAKLGWSDSVLVKQNELTSGSTWHAAGNCPTFSTSWGLLKLQRYSTELYRRIGDAVDYPINYHVVGSLRLAHPRERMDEHRHVIGMARANGIPRERMDEYRHVNGMARANGIPLELIGANEIRDRYPFLTLDDLKGALWDPNDGDIDPAQLTQALAKGARDKGAKVRRFTKVTGL